MCGIVGIFDSAQAAMLTRRMLNKVQHRAQDFAGIATCTPQGTCGLTVKKGLVWDSFPDDVLGCLSGNSAIGHVRYPTATDTKNGQPLYSPWGDGWIAIGHNGNYTNTPSLLANELADVGFQTGMDSEVALQCILREADEMPTDRTVLFKLLDRALGQMRGSGSLVMLFPHCLVAFRDSSGCRPLVWAKTRDNEYVAASEECALFGADLSIREISEVEAGTLVCFSDHGVETHRLQHNLRPKRQCVFELAYGAMVTGHVFGVPAKEFRIQLGKQLAREWPVNGAQVVVPIPESGVAAGVGFFQESAPGTFGDLDFRRDHYVGRTFNMTGQKSRDAGVNEKFQPNPRAFWDKVVVLVDDSVVRGTTSRKLVNLCREMGAREVHLRIAYPPWQYSCRYGIDTKSDEELAVVNHGGLAGVHEFIGADSLEFLSYEGLMSTVRTFGDDPSKFCDACVTGKYWDMAA